MMNGKVCMMEANKEKQMILVVDDVESNRFSLRDIILEMGLRPVLTENGAQALRMVETPTSIDYFRHRHAGYGWI